LVGDGVVIGPNAVLEPFEKLSKKRENADGDDEDIDSEEEEIESSA